MNRWVYYVVVYHFIDNQYDRYLLTAADPDAAEAEVLAALGPRWGRHHSELVCSTTDAAFFKRL
jgi:hypothetical protein